MSSTFRKFIFWPHLVAGVLAGLIIAVMPVTGVALAFQPQLLAWADRDARTVQAPAPDAPRRSVDELLTRVRAARPEAQPSGVTVYPEPTAAVLVSTGRSEGVYVNPYTGEVREMGAKGLRAFFPGGAWLEPTYSVSVAVADHPLGPWTEPKGVPPLLRTIPGRVIGPGHNSVVVGPEGQDVMVYHAWDVGQTARRMCIDPIAWTPDGPRVLGPTDEETELPRQ